MKKVILNMLMLFAVTAVATAQTITVADVEALPGETVKATLEITAPASTYTGVQLAIEFPTTGFSNVVKGTGTSFGNIQIGAMNDGKVKIAAAKDAPFENETIEVEFDVDGSLDLKEYGVTITDIQFEATGVEDNIADVLFNVIVTDRITLDEEATVAPIARSNVNVRVKRTIKENSWSTICLPFAMTEAQVKAAFGDDVLLKDFIGAETTKEGDNVVGITVKFADVTAIEANHPYLINVSSDVSEFTVDGVDIDPVAEPSVDKDEKSVKIGKNWMTFYNRFVGTYVAKTEVPELCLFISNDKFYYSNGSTKMKAFRGYFDFYDVLTAVEQGASARINMIDVEPTSIANAKVNLNANDSYFNLAGQKVQNPKKGLYIKNNKKVVLK